MADGMDVKPDQLRTRAPKFTEAADKLKAALDTLIQAHEGQKAPWNGGEGDGPWGDDENGKEFGGDYIESRDNCDEGFKNIEKALRETTDELIATADAWDAVDQAAQAGLKDAGSWT